MKIKLGIMQGRLSEKPGQNLQSFPYATWKDEFFFTKNALPKSRVFFDGLILPPKIFAIN